MGSELLIVLGAWFGANAGVGALAMLGVRIHEGKRHPEARSVARRSEARTPVAETLRDALTGDGGAHPSA